MSHVRSTYGEIRDQNNKGIFYYSYLEPHILFFLRFFSFSKLSNALNEHLGHLCSMTIKSHMALMPTAYFLSGSLLASCINDSIKCLGTCLKQSLHKKS